MQRLSASAHQGDSTPVYYVPPPQDSMDTGHQDESHWIFIYLQFLSQLRSHGFQEF